MPLPSCDPPVVCYKPIPSELWMCSAYDEPGVGNRSQREIAAAERRDLSILMLNMVCVPVSALTNKRIVADDKGSYPKGSSVTA